MAFWLARERRGQDSDYIQRFDPRFWTVNFPRPMMASVVTDGPDGLLVDAEFYHEGELAGLIWESADTLDHPLLAYVTDRDYSRTTLRFHWKSKKLIPLDQPNGPTLTIEGRDASGAPRTWYVRLWNYATGDPEDADIVLPFSSLQSGYGLPGEPVYPGDIDRMFISLVAPGFVPGSSTPLPVRAKGTLWLKNITCEGDRPMVEIGDIMLPPHQENIATGYDDAYNQTPARLLRSIRALGYRGTILHYVGMSHFFRVEPGEGRMLAAADGAISKAARRWHLDFFRGCAAQGFEVITSLSYELLADHCPAAWQQMTHDGEPARTGWVPPSALLSPANSDAMTWLKTVAATFVSYMLSSRLPVRFQIGEPWWWVTAEGKPCLYDAAAALAFGGNPEVITTLRTPLTQAQTSLLDQAGALLAQSTLDLAQAVRDAAGGSAEILLLAFTPTILDPEMPEAKRANVPIGWAWPAFDRLQLEDYDWLTTGADANRREAYSEFDSRLNYPIDQQDYLSGFVLNPEQADAYWPLIDAGLDQAADRGIEQRYVWALPQISRDGYTRLASSSTLSGENTVQAFDDILYPLAPGRDAAVSPEFSTSVAVTASGHERRNSLWSDARLRFDVGPGIRSENELGSLIAFFRARRGAARGFRLADPFDHSSNGMTGTPTATDQVIGIGDGLTASFPLIKNYGDGDEPQIRPITRPRVETLSVSVDGIVSADWSYDESGSITFANAPAHGETIRAGYLFDVPVRFAEDRLDITAANFAAGEAPSVPLVELREAV